MADVGDRAARVRVVGETGLDFYRTDVLVEWEKAQEHHERDDDFNAGHILVGLVDKTDDAQDAKAYARLDRTACCDIHRTQDLDFRGRRMPNFESYWTDVETPDKGSEALGTIRLDGRRSDSGRTR